MEQTHMLETVGLQSYHQIWLSGTLLQLVMKIGMMEHTVELVLE